MLRRTIATMAMLALPALVTAQGGSGNGNGNGSGSGAMQDSASSRHGSANGRHAPARPRRSA